MRLFIYIACCALAGVACVAGLHFGAFWLFLCGMAFFGIAVHMARDL